MVKGDDPAALYTYIVINSTFEKELNAVAELPGQITYVKVTKYTSQDTNNQANKLAAVASAQEAISAAEGRLAVYYKHVINNHNNAVMKGAYNRAVAALDEVKAKLKAVEESNPIDQARLTMDSHLTCNVGAENVVFATSGQVLLYALEQRNRKLAELRQKVCDAITQHYEGQDNQTAIATRTITNLGISEEEDVYKLFGWLVLLEYQTLEELRTDVQDDAYEELEVTGENIDEFSEASFEQYIARAKADAHTLPFEHPIPGFPVSTGFYGYTNHNGVDFRVGEATNSTIHATRAGSAIIDENISNGVYYDYGRFVRVTDYAGVTYIYAHLSTESIRSTQYVLPGKQLGVVGSTGNSTGPHLHYEVKVNGVSVMPYAYLPSSVAIHSVDQ